MCGDGSLRDQNGNRVDLRQFKNQSQKPDFEKEEIWTLTIGTTEGYKNWAKKRQSLTEEMIEGKRIPLK